MARKKKGGVQRGPRNLKVVMTPLGDLERKNFADFDIVGNPITMDPLDIEKSGRKFMQYLIDTCSGNFIAGMRKNMLENPRISSYDKDDVELSLQSRVIFFVNKFYEKNDAAHGLDHIEEVHSLAIKMARSIVYTRLDLIMLAVYFHDTMVHNGRVDHELKARDLVLSKECNFLFENICKQDRELVAQAVAEHRASYTGKFTSVLSEIVSSADRGIPDFKSIYERSLEYASAHGFKDPKSYTVEHMIKKYGRNGYANYPILYKNYFKKELEAMWCKIDKLEKRHDTH